MGGCVCVCERERERERKETVGIRVGERKMDRNIKGRRNRVRERNR